MLGSTWSSAKSRCPTPLFLICLSGKTTTRAPRHHCLQAYFTFLGLQRAPLHGNHRQPVKRILLLLKNFKATIKFLRPLPNERPRSSQTYGSHFKTPICSSPCPRDPKKVPLSLRNPHTYQLRYNPSSHVLSHPVCHWILNWWCHILLSPDIPVKKSANDSPL